MKKEIWWKETARDIISLGSLPFFLLVIVRVLIPPVTWNYVSEFILAGVIFFLLYLFLKQDLHSGLGLILLLFISIFYNNLNFAIFASLIYICLLVSLFYLKKDRKGIIFGIISGALSSLISYFIIKQIFS